ncbi:S-adenosyl-L-methionine-dependent methyltransferase, partial [Fomitiporia mediterranea MF3/22]|uniref:S-adenosyl-L-methionine-dependent methyltransferase n=1 Tax=Fomitiporia mediterranea (strain MF3/22) TaxID=694068 RepID=UPI0004408EF7
RLNVQHEFLTDVLGGRLILDKDVKLGPGDRVLDSGTGAGSWIIALSKQVPKAVELIGTDISSAMFPEQVPDNVHLFEASSTDLPFEWIDTFTLISQRLLCAALTVPLWRAVLSELLRVLKPGGTIQFMEFGQFGSTVDVNLIPTCVGAIDMATAVMTKRDLLGIQSGIELPGMLEEIGFSDVRVKVYEAPVGKTWGEIGLKGEKITEGFLRATGRLLMAEGGLGIYSSQAEVDSMIDRAKKEWNENPGTFLHYYTIIARKPL